MKNILSGVICGAFVFAALSWASPRQTTARAAAFAAPAAGRYQFYPSPVANGYVILDTESGCIYAVVAKGEIPAGDALRQTCEQIRSKVLAAARE